MPLRPTLPLRHENPHLKTLDSDKLPPVKYQMLDRDGHEVLVGRMKIPTPTGHAFILRRFDTGAISLTTMFRAAFPTAGDIEEKKEIAWVKEAYDLSGNNGSLKEPTIIRLAGTWLSPEVALLPDFAETYNLTHVIPHMAKAVPDPSTSYRRSTKANSTPKAQTQSPVHLPTPAQSMVLPTPKRRRESSPAPAPVQAPRQTTPTSLPPPRRSARTKSPAPMPLPMEVKSPRSVKATKILRVAEVGTPGGSDETIVEEEAETIEISRPNMSQDIAEQKELIDGLKAKREAAKKKTEDVVMDTEMDMEAEAEDAAPASVVKRPREEEEQQPLQFEFKEPEVEERQIATNKRVGMFQMGPKKKSFAWGVAAFAVGLGAVSFLPNFF
ncbi:hypothetical protein SERLA73DRAFT_152557 [Serpula lacrymans var. lacrymans S7.3]|uniref:HTH APSES-type domain-containing protein n=1 Tax=Serpula lacrymans var. lacrymans (strain S7.3) TaxID=936435 RepID=F8PXU7_SERL3|nr:hypothetical protein SERLA73DRAFT_152557 [Serpula lacrymans var. lacrymans S7.3]